MTAADGDKGDAIRHDDESRYIQIGAENRCIWVLALVLLGLLIAGLLIPTAVQAAAPLAGRTVVVDAGHGGDIGARGPDGSVEDANVLAIARRLQGLLESAGASVVMTRQTEAAPTHPTDEGAGQLASRMAIANASGADIFISIHNNAHRNARHQGMSVYHRDDRRSTSLAAAIQPHLVKATGREDQGVHPATFYVLRTADMPAVLVEAGFISNPTEAQLLQQPDFRQRIAQGISDGVTAYFGHTPNGSDDEAEDDQGRSDTEPPRDEAGGGGGAGPDGGAGDGGGSDERTTPGRRDGAARAGPSYSFEVDHAADRIVWGHWARWSSDDAPLDSVTEAGETLDVLSEYRYDLDDDADLTERQIAGAASDLSRALRISGAQVMTMVTLTDVGEKLSSESWRSAAVRRITELVESNDYAGVHLSAEGIDPSRRDDFTTFVRELSGSLHGRDRRVAVAVGARTAESNADHPAALYDYERLARWADYLVIMAYDHHGAWSSPGPVAGIEWVRRVVDYALSQAPAETLLLGLAGYGYDWGPDDVESIRAADAARLARRQEAAIRWDAKAQAPTFSYVDDTGGEHTVWYENSYSAARKIDVANRRDLAGVALWRLGQEDARLWGLLGAGFPEPPAPVEDPPALFADARNHWAREEVEALVNRRAVDGFPDGTFRPERPLTRAAYLRMLLSGLGLDQLLQSRTGRHKAPYFADVSRSHWAFPDVQLAARIGIVNGRGSGFRPEAPVSRAEMVAMLSRAAAQLQREAEATSAQGPPGFDDIQGHWAAEDVSRAAQAGWIEGTGQGHFHPDRRAKRGAGAAVLSRFVSEGG